MQQPYTTSSGTVPSTVEEYPDQTFQLDRTIAEEFNQTRARVCGIVHIFLGVVLLGLGITAIIIECALSTIGTAIWCGVFIIIAGCIGCWASRGRSRGVIITSMVLSIIAAAVCGTLLLVTSLVAISHEIDQSEECSWNYFLDYDHDSNYWNSTCHTIYYPNYVGRLTVDGLILAIAGLESIVAIVQVITCSKAACRQRRNPDPVCYVVGQGTHQNAQLVVLPVGQTIHYAPPAAPTYINGVQQSGQQPIQAGIMSQAGTMGQPYQAGTMGQPYQAGTMGQPYQAGTIGQPYQMQPQLVFQPMQQNFPQHRVFKSEQAQFQGVV